MITQKIKTWNQLSDLCQTMQNQGLKIVFSNGCFDVLHCGHVQYLEEARACGDVLIVGLNSDESVKRLKGNSRPINSETDRLIVIAGLESVDYVTLFAEDTPYQLIKLLQPDVLVKGGDWKPEDIVGSDIVLANGGLIKSLGFTEGKSSTAIINALGMGK
ncbi:MAG: D-glycero-beta-D-manno-heptose 1-phosphate adenylyltransferase [Candidatus Cloacimonadaceae bacterium]|nr:D-glycero-beta-D-manno-heptose 1-phosphate adenylyltransferase [Candidatus Cloacimonadaceae bacterium]